MLDWFAPAEIKGDEERHFRARIFLISHLLGTPIGHLLCLYLYFIEPRPGFAFWSLLILITLFFAHPFLLRRGWRFSTLAKASLLQLTFIILFAAYNYGGVYSPFLAWSLVVPLLALFYLGGSGSWTVLAVLAAGLGLFEGLFLAGHRFPETIPFETIGGLGVFSALGAAAFVSMMSIYYANIFSLQRARLQTEIRNHLATEGKLLLAKEEAESASRAKSEFLATMSHELRTPLNAIIGFSQVISSQLFGPVGNQKYLSYVGDIEHSGQHLLNLINEILDLAKIESGKFTLDEADIEVGGLIREAVDLIRPLALQGRITIDLDCPQTGTKIRADELRLRQILLNLLSNAVKFTDAGGRIAVALEIRRETGIAIRVEDTGIGIPPEDIERVMQPFEQVGSHLARHTGGTGLGLPLARELAAMHGGELALASQLGKGTCITLTLPATRIIFSGAPQHGQAQKQRQPLGV